MKSAFDMVLEVVLGIAGAVAFGSLAVALAAVGLGCVVFGGCWSYFGWRRRREQPPEDEAG